MTRLSAPTAYTVLALFGLFALSGCDDAPGMCPDGDDSCNADAGAEPDGGPGPEVDCAGAPGGSATVDMCGVCDDDPANDCAMDCAGEWGGDAIADMCGVCDDDPTNDCVDDCAGVLDGDAAVDDCGRCAGGSTGLTACVVSDFDPVADATIRADMPGANFGSEAELLVEGDQVWTLPRFDLTALVEDSVIDAATLHVHGFAGDVGGGAGEVRVFAANESDGGTVDEWQEDTVAWMGRPGRGRELGRFTYDGTAPADIELAGDGLTAEIQREVFTDNRLLTLIFVSDMSSSRYRAREHDAVEERPRLVVGAHRGTVVELEAGADTHVDETTPDAVYGSSEALRVFPDSLGPAERRVFLRFDLSGLDSSAAVAQAELQLMAFTGYAYGGDGRVYTHFVPDDAWDEAAVSWSTQPEIDGENLGWWWVWYDGTPRDAVASNGAPALTQRVQAELSGDAAISLRLHSPGYRTEYRAREFADAAVRPRLRVLLDLPPG